MIRLNDLRPLEGKRIVITRARDQAGALAEALQALGAQVIGIPTIQIRDPQSWEPLDRAVRHLDDFDVLLVTSVNGVRKFLDRLRHCGRSIRDLERMEVGAIGPATAAALAEAGVKVGFVPREYRAEGLLEVLGPHDLRGKAFLIPRAKVARDLVPRALRERGARVEVVEAYETVLPAFPPGELERLLVPRPDMVTFTSSSTASNFARLLAAHQMSQTLAEAAVASIGPVTSDTVRKLGWSVTVEAPESTIPGLVRAIRGYFRCGRS